MFLQHSLLRTKQGIKLSNKAIQDLRKALHVSCGVDFDINLSDEEISEVGELLLTTLAEGLKTRQTLFGAERIKTAP